MIKSTMKLRQLLLSTGLPILALSVSLPAFAQVSVTDARTSNVATSTEGANGTASDVTIAAGGSVTVTTGAAVTLDSDNALINDGAISTENADDTTGVLISGARTGSFTNNGSIILNSDDVVGGITPTSNITQGSGRTGILISGASPFTGNIENAASGRITIEGANSAGIRLANDSILTGDLVNNGAINITGRNTVGIGVEGDVIGNLAFGGAVVAIGENTEAISVSGDVTGGVTLTGAVTSTAYVSTTGATVTQRQTALGRAILLETGSIRQAGSALHIAGNVSEGIHIEEIRAAETNVVTAVGTVNFFGSAPAILIDGDANIIDIGRVEPLTDTDNEDLQYAFVSQGNVLADGLFDNINANAITIANAVLEGGINNSATLQATSYRGGFDTAAVETADTLNTHARVLVIGDNAVVERINNTGTIQARGLEATDLIYADRENILSANRIFATAINIETGATAGSIDNFGTISAVLVARDGRAVAIRDESGTLVNLSNHGAVNASAANSDTLGEETTNFELIAIDVSANTTGFTYNQSVDNPDAETVITPETNGDILLGSGDDTLNITGGSVTGDISFGDGADSLSISNGSSVVGAITDSDGQLDILVSDTGRLSITAPGDINVTNATIASTGIYTPFIDPTTNDSSVLVASNAVTFEDGAVIAPRLATVLDDPSAQFEIARVGAGGTLTFDASAQGLRGENTPFLYDTVFATDPNNANSLLMTVQQRTAQQLGLDVQQTAAYASTFQALQASDSLGAAFVGITDQVSFNSAYNQLLPEFAASARQFVMSNVDGTSGAVGSHLQNARRSQDRTGGAWIEQFAYYADRELAGLSEQFRGYGFGITGGFDTSFGPFHTVGLNLGFATTEIEDVLGLDEPMDVLTVQAGLYAGYQVGNLGIDLYAGGGYDDFEANRRVTIGAFNQTAIGNWSGTHYNASVSAGYDLKFGKKYFARPALTATYLSLTEKSYVESGSADIALRVGDRTSEVGTGSITLDIGAKFERDRSWLSPMLRVGYRNDFINEAGLTRAEFAQIANATPFAIQAAEFPDSGFILGVTFAAGSRYSSFSFDYDADLRDGFTRHTARLVLRLLF